MARLLFVLLMNLLAVTGCAHDPEPKRCFVSSPRDFSTPEPTPRMRALAQALDSNESDASGFSSEEISRLRELILYPERQLANHPHHFDQLQATGLCRVRRSYLNHDGELSRTEDVSIPCSEYWRYLALVDNFLEAKGFLPNSWLDLTDPSLTQIVEEVECPSS